MRLTKLHDWNLTPAQAVALQKQLASQVIANQPINLERVRLVAGVDVSVKNNVSQAAVVILSYPDLHIIETVLAQQPTPFPYIPGLLTFREGPILEEAFAKLEHEPDVFIFDGMGIAHPRRIGIAAHMGLWLGKPTIGCGKTYLLGKFIEPGVERGVYTDLTDNHEVIGAVLRTRKATKPVFISPGHLADIPTSVMLIMNCILKYRLPEPIRAAHHAAGQMDVL
jgi:deoxyribonuclease V